MRSRLPGCPPSSRRRPPASLWRCVSLAHRAPPLTPAGALNVLAAAAASAAGLRALLARASATADGLQPLPTLMRATDLRAKAGAWRVAAQLCATAAHSFCLLLRLALERVPTRVRIRCFR